MKVEPKTLQNHEHPTSVHKVMGSNFVEDLDFFLSSPTLVA